MGLKIEIKDEGLLSAIRERYAMIHGGNDQLSDTDWLSRIENLDRHIAVTMAIIVGAVDRARG